MALFGIFVAVLLAYVSVFGAYLVFILRNLRRGYDVNKDPTYFPTVSLIICAYNEEKTIFRKIENTLKIEYPKDKLEIIVFDNGSEDKTFEIAKKFEDRGVKVRRLRGKNKGKSAGLNATFKYASSEILAITDVDCLLKPDVLTKSMPYFADPSVGAVSGSHKASSGKVPRYAYKSSEY